MCNVRASRSFSPSDSDVPRGRPKILGNSRCRRLDLSANSHDGKLEVGFNKC